MQPNQKGFALLLAILLISALGGLLFYFLKYNGSICGGFIPQGCPLGFVCKIDQPSVGSCQLPFTSTISKQSTPTPDQTENWKTYKNEQYRYEFKYPSDWEIWSVNGSIDFPPGTPIPPPNKAQNLLIGQSTRNQDGIQTKQAQISLNVYENKAELEIREFFKHSGGWSDEYIKNMEDTSLNTLPTVRLNLSWDKTSHYFIALDEYIIDFQLSYFETDDKFPVPPEQVFAQILSTFKPIANVQTPSPETLCTQDSDCDINFCAGCKVMNKEFISPSDKACLVVCNQTPICYQGQCIPKGSEGQYQIEIK